MEYPGESFAHLAGSKVTGSTLLASPTTSTARLAGVGGLAEVTSSSRISPPGLWGSQLSSKFYKTASPSFFFLVYCPMGRFWGEDKDAPSTAQDLLVPALPQAHTSSLPPSPAPSPSHGTRRPPPATSSAASGFRDGNSQSQAEGTAPGRSRPSRAGRPKAHTRARPQWDGGGTGGRDTAPLRVPRHEEPQKRLLKRGSAREPPVSFEARFSAPAAPSAPCLPPPPAPQAAPGDRSRRDAATEPCPRQEGPAAGQLG